LANHGTTFGWNTVILTIEVVGKLKFLFFFDFVTMAVVAFSILVVPAIVTVPARFAFTFFTFCHINHRL
tara:strand:- start:206 stop:412 length:207 start_codon:yes stop_codon:yes gene_type:complete